MRRKSSSGGSRGRRRSRRGEGGGRRRARALEGVKHIDLRDCDLLRKFVTDHGKIIPARLSGVSAAQQRKIRRGIRRARVMGLLP
jgi:small subunit ribosomal protein S18